MINKVVLFFVLSMAASSTLFAQETKIEIIRDSMISVLQEFRKLHAINPNVGRETISLAERTIDKRTAKRVKTRGFRVQIFSGSSRSEATNVQNEFLRENSGIGAYLNYEEPNFRVKVGDFRTRNEANAFLRKLSGRYSNLFVFVEDIWIWQ